MTNHNALVRILLNSDAQSAANEFLNWLILCTNASTRPKFYLASPRSGCFVEFAVLCPAKLPYAHIEDDEYKIVCGRGDFCIGFVQWRDASVPLTDDDREIARSIIDEIYRRFYFESYLSSIRKPVDFTKQHTYYRGTAMLISEVLQMEMVAIRQINDSNDLQCLAFYRHPEEYLRGSDFDGDKLPPPFAEVVASSRRAMLLGEESQRNPTIEVVDEPNGARHGFLLDDPLLFEIKTFFIFPIVVGEDFFGVISCASRLPVKLSSLEQSAVETAMHLFSVAISNFNRFHETKRLADVIHEQLFSMTHMEVTQSAKHELMNIEAEQALHIDELRDFAKISKDRSLGACVEKLGVSVENLTASIRKLSWNGFVAAPRIDSRSLESVWMDAVGLLEARLGDNDIKPRFIGGDISLKIYPEWLKDAFLNLVLNSIDAFKERPKQHRTIQLQVRHEHTDESKVVLDYSDNAGGINYAKIQIPDGIKMMNAGMRQEEFIFQAKVTSKKKKPGSGWGLYLVRQAVGLHKGSVYLRSTSKEGVTFRLTLSRRLSDSVDI